MVRFLLNDGRFSVRGITRNKDSPAAKVLKAQGVEIIQANFDDVQNLVSAFEGAHAVYGVTNYWEHGGDGETRHGQNMVGAAKAAKVKHFVYSIMGIVSLNCD